VLSRSGVQSEPFTLAVDHHARMKRRTTAARREAQVLHAETESRRRLWEPFSHIGFVTDDEVERALTTASARRPMRLVDFEPPEVADWRERRAEELADANLLDGL